MKHKSFGFQDSQINRPRENNMTRLFVALLAVLILHLAFFNSQCLAETTWQAIGPFGGTVNALAIDPTNNQTLYAGTGAGIYKSNNGGASWIYTDWSGSHLTIDHTNPQTFYRWGADGIFKSINAGISWNLV